MTTNKWKAIKGNYNHGHSTVMGTIVSGRIAAYHDLDLIPPICLDDEKLLN